MLPDQSCEASCIKNCCVAAPQVNATVPIVGFCKVSPPLTKLGRPNRTYCESIAEVIEKKYTE